MPGHHEPFVGEGRRHVQVEYHDIDGISGDARQEFVARAGRYDHLDADGCQQRHQRLPEDSAVFGDGYSHGRTILTVVPCAVAPSTSTFPRSTPILSDIRANSEAMS